ncbi:hypothetical protein ES705_22608 [subsurface metagenome]
MGENSRLIHEFNKNASEVVRVRFVNYNNGDMLDIRVWVLRHGGDYIPTKKVSL